LVTLNFAREILRTNRPFFGHGGMKFAGLASLNPTSAESERRAFPTKLLAQ